MSFSLRAAFSAPLLIAVVSALIGLPAILAQQTLGGITGEVRDASGRVIPHAAVTLTGEQIPVVRMAMTDRTGQYQFVHLPIGRYTLQFAADGFEGQRIGQIAVQGASTATVNAAMQVGQTTTTIEVEATPLMNTVDTTVGYVLDPSQIDAIPLPTGSFVGLAILTPGVNTEPGNGTSAANGLGNQPIWANGQRDTSNMFQLNGVDASNLFNGKSTSSVNANRIVANTGGPTGAGGLNAGAGGVVSSAASVYLAIGQALPTPAPETLSEVRVNSAMYDAQQGSTSGAHIDMSTASGTNTFHGMAWLNRGTNWLNAAPFFFKQDPSIPANEKNPQLHRWTAGFAASGPLVHNRLLAFVSYQQVHVSDQESGISHLDVPQWLTDRRDAATLATLANTYFNCSPNTPCALTAQSINPVALFLMNARLPGGEFMIPSPTVKLGSPAMLYNASARGTSYFFSKQSVVDLDWIASQSDTLAVKYYGQADPGRNPYAYSNVAGWTQRLDAGSQVLSINNSWTATSHLSTTQTLGFIREKEYGANDQPFTPAEAGMNLFGSPIFPGITIVDALGTSCPQTGGARCGGNVNNPAGLQNHSLSIGAGGYEMGSYTGVFQNRWTPSAAAIWIHGRHTLALGGSYSHTQLNLRDNRSQYGSHPGQAMISVANFGNFLAGAPLAYNANFNFATSAYLVGNANRYLRAPQATGYMQDRFQVRSTLSLTAGLRYDWNGAFSEKYGHLYNFDPSRYVAPTQDAPSTESGLIFPSNYKYPTPGVSSTTLTGRQWGVAPRLGIAWNPRILESKMVVRSGAGIYYDRGELFSYLSPGFAAGVVTGGPYGVSQSPPFVRAIYPNGAAFPYAPIIPNTSLSNPFCDPMAGSDQSGYSCGSLPTAPTGNPSTYTLPAISAIARGLNLPSFAVYDRKATLPYTLNFSVDVQYQFSRTLMVEIGYVGNRGHHQVIPLPFNQARIATPAGPVNGERYSYGYTVSDAASNPLVLPIGASTQGNVELYTFEGGNVDLRVPYLGYSAEAERYSTVGIASYDALQTHIEKRLSHGLAASVSYTYSHALDEQSAMGLFFSGNNPQHLRESYASSDFDRTHVLTFSYLWRLPSLPRTNGRHTNSIAKKLLNDWTVEGITLLESGQPYSMVDYSGAVASIYYSVNDGITDPILPLAAGFTPKSARSGHSGAFGLSAFKTAAFTIPDMNYNPGLAPGGALGVPPPGSSTAGNPVSDIFETGFTTGQRNIFRQAFQKRADLSLVKVVALGGVRASTPIYIKYTLNIFNVSNTPSFDIPNNNPSFGSYNPAPIYCAAPTNTPSDACYGVTDHGYSAQYPSTPTFGFIHSTIGSGRQVQMSLHLNF